MSRRAGVRSLKIRTPTAPPGTHIPDVPIIHQGLEVCLHTTVPLRHLSTVGSHCRGKERVHHAQRLRHGVSRPPCSRHGSVQGASSSAQGSSGACWMGVLSGSAAELTLVAAHWRNGAQILRCACSSSPTPPQLCSKVPITCKGCPAGAVRCGPRGSALRVLRPCQNGGCHGNRLVRRARGGVRGWSACSAAGIPVFGAAAAS